MLSVYESFYDENAFLLLRTTFEIPERWKVPRVKIIIIVIIAQING